MLVERVVRAVCDRGLDVDSILVITYTRRAAGELRTRIRAALLERGRHELARELDGAWISTIHGFCARLLRAYPLAAGLDPRFRELDEAQAAVLRSEAFGEALAEFCSGNEPQRLELLATYGSGGLRRMLTSVYETLRAAGRELDLEVAPRPELGERVEELRTAATVLAADPDATDAQAQAANELLELLERDRRPDRLMGLGGFKARGDRAAAYCEALAAVEQAALDEAAARDRALLQELLTLFAGRYAEAKARESALDFEDLQLEARDLLRSQPELREREQARFRSILVDEFQDTNRLQTEIVDLLRTPETELFFVGDEFQSIYGFRHADVQVFRERRDAVEQPLSLTLNYRSRPEVLAAVNELFGSHFGGEFQELAAAAEFPDPVFGHPVELLVTDKESYKDSGVHWRRGEARAVARRVRELVDAGAATPGEIVLLFAAGTDAEWYEDELRRAGLPTYRATGKGYFGQQQVVDLLTYLRLLQNRYDDEALARGARVAVRRRLERRARALIRRVGLASAALRRDRARDAAGARRARRAAPARVPPALRPARRRDAAALPRAAVRADRGRARLRPRGARAVGRPPALRQHAQARAPRALVRGAARARRRGLRPLRRRAGSGRRAGARGGRRGGGRRRGAAPHDPRGEGARVQGRDRRRRRARPRAAVAGRDPRAARRPLRLPRRRSRDGEAPRRLRLRGGQGGARRRRSGPSACASTTSR